MLALTALFTFALAPSALACGDDAKGCGGVCATEAAATPAKEVAGQLVTTTYKVAMSCQNCARGINNTLSKVPGVAKVAVDFDKQAVTVTHGAEATLVALNTALKGHFKLEPAAEGPAAVPAPAKR
jgi:copper chaperone CopZ